MHIQCKPCTNIKSENTHLMVQTHLLLFLWMLFALSKFVEQSLLTLSSQL